MVAPFLLVMLVLPLSAQDFIQSAVDFPGQEVFSIGSGEMLVEYLDSENQDQTTTPFFLQDLSLADRYQPEELWRGRTVIYTRQDEAHVEMAYHTDAVKIDGLIYAVSTRVRLFEGEPFIFAKTVSISDPSGGIEGSELTFETEFEELPGSLGDRHPGQIVKVGDFLYVCLRNLGLRVIDVSDPMNMTVVDAVERPVVGVTAEENRLGYIYEHYIEDQPFHFLAVLDVTDPANPQWVEEIRFDMPFDWLTIYNQYLVLHIPALADGNELFAFLNLRSENLQEEFTQFWSGYEFSGLNIAFADGKMFGSGYSQVDSCARIGVWNLDNPLEPQLESSMLVEDLDPVSYQIAADSDELGDWIYLFGSHGDTEAGMIHTYYYGPESAPESPASIMPAEFRIAAAFPNPFNSTLSVSIDLPQAADLKVDLVDAAGRVVADVFDQATYPGVRNISFEVNDLPAGVYFVRAQSGSTMRTVKVALVR